MTDKTKLTSVKVLKNLYDNFKIINVSNTDMSLQRLTNRAIHLYINDSEFRKKIDTNDKLLTQSGSNF